MRIKNALKDNFDDFQIGNIFVSKVLKSKSFLLLETPG